MIILAITSIAFLGALFCWHWQDSQRLGCPRCGYPGNLHHPECEARQ